MAFQACLDAEGKDRAGRRLRAQAQSAVLHGGLLLLLILTGRATTPPASIAVARMPLAVPVTFPRPASGPAAHAALAGAAGLPRARAPRRRPRANLANPRVAASVLTASMPTAPAQLDGESRDEGGAGVPDGAGEGGSGGGRPGRRRAELFARIIGSGIRPGTAVRSDRPFISLKEATTLRTADFFPRLPAALWNERAPYLVALEVCVSEEGWVSEASLRSHASERLDPIVLAAVRGWRYQPRLQQGRPTPFCHGVLIRYEVSY